MEKEKEKEKENTTVKPSFLVELRFLDICEIRES